MIFFTSDSHFCHQKILEYCPNRKFASVEDHNEHLIKVWNQKVQPNDTIFHCGDFSFGSVEQGIEILQRLNGKKVLISGNHDARHLNKPAFCAEWRAIFRGYHEVEVNYKGHTTLIVLCHYPLQSWNKDRYGSFHFHGHSHGNKIRLQLKNMQDIGVDLSPNHAPWGKDEILDKLTNEGISL